LTDTDKTKHNYIQQQHTNLNNQARELLTYAQTKVNETTDQIRGLLAHQRKGATNYALYKLTFTLTTTESSFYRQCSMTK